MTRRSALFQSSSEMRLGRVSLQSVYVSGRQLFSGHDLFGPSLAGSESVYRPRLLFHPFSKGSVKPPFKPTHALENRLGFHASVS